MTRIKTLSEKNSVTALRRHGVTALHVALSSPIPIPILLSSLFQNPPSQLLPTMPIPATVSPMPYADIIPISKCPVCFCDGGSQRQCLCNHKMQQIAISQAQRADIRPPPIPILGDITRQRMMQSRTGYLYSGSRFKGEQKSDRNSYEVSVDIQHVDLNESFLCGYLHIKGLTNDYPELTTFFEAEVIGPKYSFLTRKWEADESIDQSHWKRFAAFTPALQKQFNKDGFVYDFTNKDYLFMRWKEHFLVPDHRVNTIDGASFAGFYYICYHRASGNITGFYFHLHSEWYQKLELKPVEDRGFTTFEFL